MTEAEIYGEIRELIGSPGVNDVSNRKIGTFVRAALAWMADELEFRVVTDDLSMALVAEQQEYPLPSDFLTMLWVEHDDKRLEPIGLAAFDRDQHDWRGQPSGTPVQYAIRGRRLVLYPKPDSAAVSADSRVAYSFVGAPRAMSEAGPQDLSDNDNWLLIYRAALDFVTTYPDEKSATRIPGYQQNVSDRLSRAKSRWVGQGAAAAKHHYPSLQPRPGRMGGAR